ncbi:hypothetical protein AMS68_001866 [Peltaster fructicola]|uniref:Protein SDA1 n=1 Tax=Peltaster fructicola TaxID=286661 RepID=A0A6H0XNZ5_9PEZI|nr:hypothetical protein AMS68_001866 [Peltaster fructicola]
MKRKVSALEKVDADLPNLRHKIRTDSSSYQLDFQAQYDQYLSLKELFLQSPTTTDDSGLVRLRDLVDFVSHVADCYPALTANFSSDLISLLESHHATLDTELRDKLTLRALLYQKIISELRTSNNKSTNHKLNRSFQTVCHTLIASNPSSPKGIWAVKVTRELWKRQVWSDAKAVGIMEAAAISEDAKIITGGARFFLGGDQEREEAAAEEDTDDEGHVDMAKLRHQAGINKKTGKRANELRDAAKKAKRQERKKNAPHQLNFSALHLLNDPQGFAEKLFQQHLQPKQPKVRLNLEQKLLVLQLVSRLVGLHQLTLVSLYSYFIKYLTPKQPSVTSFLASLAQSSHNLVPPDVLEPLVVKIANEFVSEAAASEVASAGLNAIREVCVRQPLAMSETLLQDLVQYRKSKDKGVQMAARGLLSLYRGVGAEMLKKRDRGKDAALGLKSGEKRAVRFGEVAEGGIEGIELLEKWKEEQGIESAEDEANGWNNWDAESDDSESSAGWVNVESDGEEIDISDSEDEKENKTNGATEKQPEAATALKEEEQRMSKLATTRILTPADLAKLNELRQSAAVISSLPAAKRRKMQQAQELQQRHADDGVTAEQIEGLAMLSKKATKEEKIRMAKGEDDEKNDHRSTTARRKEKKASEGKSTTNKEKARKKNFLMTLGKAKRKGKRSLVEERKILRGHVERKKRGGRRGNK